MKRFLYIFVISLSFVSISLACESKCGISKCDSESKTFFRPRSAIEEVDFFLGLNWYNYYSKYFEPNAYNLPDEDIHIAAGVFFQKSKNNHEHSLSNYFFPLTDDESNITPDPTDQQIFESVLTLAPERKMVGAYFDYHQDFCNNFWVDAKFAIYEATHNLRPCEKTLSTNPNFQDICTPLCFLGSNQLNYGKVANQKLKALGFDDIEIKVGYNYYFCNNKGYLGLYGSGLIPIADKPSARFLFAPMVGRAHWGLGAGFDFGYSVYKSENKSVTFLADCSYQYLFRSTELRSLDFKLGPLSRFMAASTIGNTAESVPAINYTTMCLDVTPRSVVNFWTALHFQRCRWHAELGYNLWFRQAEKVCFKDCQKPPFDGLGLGVYADTTFIPLAFENLDLASASHSQVLTNKVYLALSYDTKICQRDMNIGIAGSFEFTKKINAVEQWGIWGNFETSF
ncbi:MAG: hypothetical protein P4L22_00560 [Candidatus Babeliales bacterium]|nr:hypothetical protein [Candidatus Babeliales bacterium]